MELTRAARPATTTEPKAELANGKEEKRFGIESSRASIADLKMSSSDQKNKKTVNSHLRSTGFTNKPSLMGTKTSSRSATMRVGVRSD